MFTLNLDSMSTSLETTQASRCQGLSARRCTIIRMPSEDNEALYNIIDGNEPWQGRMLFTGPDGNKDHLMTIEPEHRQIGIGTMSWEGTSETDYLWRPATGTPFHKSRGKNVGEVGWCVPQKADWQVPQSGKQIMLGQFRQACEDRHSHLYQNAWYPGPNEEIPETSDAALVMNVFRPKTTQHHKSGSFRTFPSKRRYRRTPSATQTTNFYTHHNYHTPTRMEEQESSESNNSAQ